MCRLGTAIHSRANIQRAVNRYPAIGYIVAVVVVASAKLVCSDLRYKHHQIRWLLQWPMIGGANCLMSSVSMCPMRHKMSSLPGAPEEILATPSVSQQKTWWHEQAHKQSLCDERNVVIRAANTHTVCLLHSTMSMCLCVYVQIEKTASQDYCTIVAQHYH